MDKPPVQNGQALSRQIGRRSALSHDCGHRQGSDFMVWLLVLFLIAMIAAYTAFMWYCCCHPGRFEVPSETEITER
jgi:hypothetical protein